MYEGAAQWHSITFIPPFLTKTPMGGDVFYGRFFGEASASSGWLVADLTRVLPACFVTSIV